MKALPERQRFLVAFVCGYFTRHGYMPTIAEVGHAMEISGAAAELLMRAATRSGYMRRHPGTARAIEIRRLQDGTRVRAALVPVEEAR